MMQSNTHQIKVSSDAKKLALPGTIHGKKYIIESLELYGPPFNRFYGYILLAFDSYI